MEILKENNKLKIIKLSDRKLLFKTNINVLTSDFEIIDSTKINLRYKIDKEGIYQMIGNMRFMNILSQKFGVKVKNMYLCYETQVHLDKSFRMITGIRVKDTSWVRNYKLKQLLFNEISCNK